MKKTIMIMAVVVFGVTAVALVGCGTQGLVAPTDLTRHSGFGSFTWTSVNGAHTYEMRLFVTSGTNYEFTFNIPVGTTGGTTATANGITITLSQNAFTHLASAVNQTAMNALPSALYVRAEVRAVDADGNFGGWSNAAEWAPNFVG